ncbi:MAG: diaminopimelate decarboxylase [Deltaproteobacteria bacterium]|nr:diaminopimelate decarboxylase [Deltaproteobacteria bacterium]
MNKTDDGFSYLSGALHCEGVPMARIAEDVGTPTYVYSRNALVNRVRRLQTALGTENACQIYFAVKACSNIHILEVLRSAGCGADIVSSGELFRASVAQIPGELVVFSGIGKTEKEISEGLKAGIHIFNVESLAELLTIERLAYAAGTKARVALRVNPNVDAKTHPYISTGLKKNKFGLAPSELREIYAHLEKLRAVNICGLSCHIGSQILNEAPFVKAWKELIKTAQEAPFDVTYLDLGGGLGIRYQREKEYSLERFGALVQKTFKGLNYKLGIEPGRSIIGPVGMLLSQLVVTKKRGSRGFYILDAGMNDLLRPALYGATHLVSLVELPKTRKFSPVDLVGPVCESSDSFQTGVRLPALKAGALLAFGNAGAYGMTMSSQYNSRPRPAEVLVDGSSYQVIRTRETYADLIQREL